MFALKAPTNKLDVSPKQAPILKSNSLMGHMKMLRENSLGLFQRGLKEVGDVARIRMMHIYLYAVYHPEHVRHVLVTNLNNYRKQTRGYAKLRLLLGDGLVTSEGEFWRRQRRIAQPAFARSAINGFAQTMIEATQQMLARWDKDGLESVDLSDEMMRLTLNIAGQTLFSCDLSDQGDALGHAVEIVLTRFNDLVSSPIPHLEKFPTRKNREFNRARKTMDELVYKLIDERRNAKSEIHDLLSMFVNTRDEETGEGMTNKQLRDEALTMLLAGHETTANALNWTFYLLSQHPEILEKVEKELEEVLGGKAPTLAQLKQLTYTSQVFKESMRLYPPVWILARRAEEADVIDGYHIPKGAYVIIPTQSIHRHPDIWENPDEFIPERFSPERLEEKKALGYTKFAYFPFSAGQRKCIGDHFATMEGLLILSTVLQRYRLTLKPGFTPRPAVVVQFKCQDLHITL